MIVNIPGFELVKYKNGSAIFRSKNYIYFSGPEKFVEERAINYINSNLNILTVEKAKI